jgi:hypothetical protein
MTARITLTTPQTALVAGIHFVDGIAEVDELGTNKREFFTNAGAKIEALSDAGVPLEDMTGAQLTAFAAEQTPPIEHPSGIKVADLRALVIAAVESRAQAPASSGIEQPVSEPITGPEA